MSRDNVTAMAIAVLLAIAPAFAQDGGGEVTNEAPTHFTQPTNSEGASASPLETDVISGVIRDANGELDIQNITISATGDVALGPFFPTSATMAAANSSTTTDNTGAYDANGWKVWDSGGADGNLSYEFQFTYTTTGYHNWTVSALDEAGAVASNVVSTLVIAAYTLAADPVASDGTAATGANWGAWTATPAGSNVNGTNWLKITNSGDLPTASVTTDFSGTTFNHASLANTVSLDGNVKFWVSEVSAGQNPADGVFSTAGADADGAITVTFTGLGNIYYVGYEIVAFDTIVPDGSYSQSYTVNQS